MVGMLAAVTHLLVFRWVLDWVAPEWANMAGFVVAFWVSFLGHRWASFRDARTGVRESLLKFAFTACAGFATNEVVFVLVHRVFNGSVWLAVFAGMLGAAAQTFALSRYWAFKR
jgi:putative flippase GtrA